MTTLISYAITTHNETNSLEELVDRVNSYMRDGDELVILDDFSTNQQTKDILGKCNNVHTSKFTGDYASHKNKLNDICKHEYIFQLDGDELPSEVLLHNIKEIINSNKVDLMLVPRENIVNGIEDYHLRKWNWIKDDKNRINYPDYQGRIYKNTSQIKWTRELHEYIDGHVTFGRLPSNSDLDILHTKDISTQEKSNERYDTNYNEDFSRK